MKLVRSLCLGWVTAPLLLAASIDFNPYPSETLIRNQYLSDGVVFTTRTGTNVFDSSITGYIGFVGVNTPAIVNSPQAGLIRETRQQFLTLDFLVPVYALAFDYANMGNASGILPGAFKAYDANGVLLESRQPTSASFTALETIIFTSSGISKLELESPAVNWVFAVDNVNFTAVPEPASAALIVVALMGIAAFRRLQ